MRLNRFTVGITVGAICVIAILAFVLTGKGGDANLVSGSAIAEAADATSKVQGANLAMHISAQVDGVSDPIVADLNGVSSQAGQSAHLSGAYKHFPKKVPGQLPDGSVPVASVVIMPHVYMKSPLFASELPPGKEWIGYDAVKAGQQLGIGDPTRFNQGNPMQVLSTLRAASPRVERVGAEDVRSVPTTHYRAKVELRRLPGTLAPAQRQSAQKSIARLIDLMGSDSYPVDVWIDRHHMVRRVRLVMQMKVAQTGRSMKMDMTTEMFGFGRKSQPKAPPADSVYDVTKLAGRTP
jgi:hypothetical protein